MKNVLVKLKAKFKFCETIKFDPFADLTAEYFIVDPSDEDGLPASFPINVVDYEKIADGTPSLENWTEEESLLHGLFGRTEQTLVTQYWQVLCKFSLPQDCDFRLMRILFCPNKGAGVESTFSCEIEDVTII